MAVRSLGWLGVRTRQAPAMTAFYRDVLQFEVILERPDATCPLPPRSRRRRPEHPSPRTHLRSPPRRPHRRDRTTRSLSRQQANSRIRRTAVTYAVVPMSGLCSLAHA